MPAGPPAPNPRAPVVAVIGPAEATTEEATAARSIGRRLASAGVTVVCGGLGGVMAAACEGAREADGLTVGLLPGTDPADANPHVVVAIPTGLGEGRNLLVVRAADAVVAVGGAYGTLSEIALALRADTPVVGLGTWQLTRRGAVDPGIEVATDAADAAHRVLAMVGVAP